MVSVNGYYAGGVCIPTEKLSARQNQKVIITLLEEKEQTVQKPSVEDGLRFLNKIKGSVFRDIDIKKELAEARDEKYGTAH